MRKNILVLYVEVMPYNIPVFKNLIESGYILYVVQLGYAKLTPFIFSDKNYTIRDISSFRGYYNFLQFCINVDPCMIYISEVMNSWYWRVARYYKKKNKSLPIVLGSDAQWTGSINNWIKKISYSFTYDKCFTHAFVAGLWQCEYARRIGFKRNQITFPVLSANVDLYHKVNIQDKRAQYPKRFLFVGRLHPNKGISYLLDAWKSISNKNDWHLTIIGNGPLKKHISEQPDLEVLDFKSQEDICNIMSNVGCAIIPSVFEPWGLVIHEAVAAGLPIIVTSACGATQQFVIDNYNGLIVKEKNTENLSIAMKDIISTPYNQLLLMGERSRELSKRITPELVAQAYKNLIRSSIK